MTDLDRLAIDRRAAFAEHLGKRECTPADLEAYRTDPRTVAFNDAARAHLGDRFDKPRHLGYNAHPLHDETGAPVHDGDIAHRIGTKAAREAVDAR